MIEYDRTSWWGTCFSWAGTVLPHVLPRVGLLTGACLLLTLFDDLVLKPQGKALVGLNPLGHTVLGVALSMLIVFRTNSAHTRFWEARSHWGVIVNNTRNLVRMAAVFAPPADELAMTVSAYVIMLKEQLRDNDPSCIRHLVPGRVLRRLAKSSNPAQVLASFMTEWIVARQKEGRLDSIEATRLEGLVALLVDNQGGCEKIRRTPLPFAYAALIKQTLFIYLGTLPFVMVPIMGYAAPLVLMGVSLGMLGIEEAGVEIEDPFGLDPNHLPLDGICAGIGRDMSDLTADEEAAGGR